MNGRDRALAPLARRGVQIVCIRQGGGEWYLHQLDNGSYRNKGICKEHDHSYEIHDYCNLPENYFAKKGGK